MTNIFSNIDLFRYINKYTDLRSLCDTCLLFATLKKYINYKLNKKYSLMYYDDISFRNMVLHKIFNPYKQLDLYLSLCDNITDVSTLGNVHTLDLSCCDYITDVSALGNVHTLILSGCCNITDVSAFGNVNTLDLRSCNKITDVSALGKVHTLNLSHCDITDVSALGKVHNLDLSYCQNITDVSMLENVHTLNLSYCNITDVSALGSVHTLILIKCRKIICDNNKLTSLPDNINFSNLQRFDCYHNNLTKF
jgi:Leucine-rich repeat (LRR) protein